MRDQRVPRLVDRDGLALPGRERLAAAARPRDDPRHRLLEVLAGDDFVAAAERHQRPLVHDVLEIRPGEPHRAAGERLEVDVGGERLAAGVEGEDGRALGPVRQGHLDAAVEAAGAQQRRVEDVAPVRRADDDDRLPLVEAVELHQELVQRLLVLLVALGVAAAAANGVDLVDEDDGRGVAARLGEEVAHALGADADVDLDELGGGDGEEGDARLAGHRPGEERLARARRARQQHAAGHPRPHPGEALRVAQEGDDLLQLLLHLAQAGHVREGEPRALDRRHRRALAPAEAPLLPESQPQRERERAGRDQALPERPIEAGSIAHHRTPLISVVTLTPPHARRPDQAARSSTLLAEGGRGNEARRRWAGLAQAYRTDAALCLAVTKIGTNGRAGGKDCAETPERRPA